MPTLRPDSIYQEWIFSPEEELQSKILSELLIKKLNTRYCELLKSKGLSDIPITEDEQRTYFIMMAGIDGQMAFITELFTNHREALTVLSDPSRKQQAEMTEQVSEQKLAEAAARQVHNS